MEATAVLTVFTLSGFERHERSSDELDRFIDSCRRQQERVRERVGEGGEGEEAMMESWCLTCIDQSMHLLATLHCHDEATNTAL